MTYLDKAIARCAGPLDQMPRRRLRAGVSAVRAAAHTVRDDDLARVFGLLAATRGVETTNEDVQQGWAWFAGRDEPNHPDLVPFAELPEHARRLRETQRDIIRRAAHTLAEAPAASRAEWAERRNRATYTARMAYRRIRRPIVRGAHVALIRTDGWVACVRHTYGDQVRWQLPGRLIGRREPEHAAYTNVGRELGVEIRDQTLVPVGSVHFRGDAPDHWAFHDTWMFAARPASRDLLPRPGEIREAEWFPLELLPLRPRPAAQCRLGARLLSSLDGLD